MGTPRGHLLLLFFFACFVQGFSQKAGPKECASAITPQFMCAQVYYLASDALRGRNTPSPGLDSAAAYIARSFRQWGLQPVNGSYFQEVPLCRPFLADSSILVATRGGNETTFRIKSDYVPYDFSGAEKATGELVFAGYGITAPEFSYDDYAGIDAKGKIVVIIRHEPQKDDSTSKFAGAEQTKYSSLLEKQANAMKHGAVGMLVMNGPLNFTSFKPRGFPWPSLSKVIPEDAMQFSLCEKEEEKMPVVHVGQALIEYCFGSVDSLRQIQQGIDRDLRPNSFDLNGVTVTLRADIRKEITRVYNVCGYIPGSDPERSQEVVIFGAHYDHVGVMMHADTVKDSIYNGADDNASGTAGVMAVARSFSMLKKTPGRSTLFILFVAEEKGLFGSRWYVSHPLLPLEQTVAMLNLDMIGRNAADSLDLRGSGKSPDITAIIKKANRKTGFKLKTDNDRNFGGSDHYTFYAKNIPFAFFHSGLHPDYHTVRDNPELIDCNKASRVAKLVFYTGLELARDDHRYRVIPDKEESSSE